MKGTVAVYCRLVRWLAGRWGRCSLAHWSCICVVAAGSRGRSRLAGRSMLVAKIFACCEPQRSLRAANRAIMWGAQM
ncbi:UNVERIFIED_CONTAM: hypothetical protein Slati_2431800 [Sesamum latifolium]|uniref:Secreted protein n=1 Tax=Sesamum latifolium TaxID=2727402 RepID=A0AAW2WDU8_9LAMI